MRPAGGRGEKKAVSVAPSGTASSSVWAVALALALVVSVAYLPALGGQFLNWDDDIHVTRNPHIEDGLSWQTLKAVFTTAHKGLWIPLTWLSHALDREVYGLKPFGHHLTALALHVANTILLFVVLRRLTGALWRSAVVAALFGLHPLHVESVAWVSERKDVLSTLFWLLAMAAYERHVRRPTRGSYLLVAAALSVGLLCKPMLVTLPFVLLLLDYWPLARLSRNAVHEKIPLVVVALAFSAVTVAAQTAAGAMEQARQIELADRVANAVFSYAKYLLLTVWPAGLSPWYSHPALEGVPLTPAGVGAAALMLIAVSLLAAVSLRRRPYVAFGWIWYLATLVPVIGLVQIGGQAMADRYTYVPLIGIFVAAVWLVGSLPWWRVTSVKSVGGALVVLILATCGVLTWQQSRIWHDSTTFWSYTLRLNPRAAVGHYAVGGMLASQGRTDEAIGAYRRAIKLRPEFWNWHAEAGDLLYGRDRISAAGAHYRRAIELNPDEPVTRNSMANVLIRQERFGPARRQLEEALKLRPKFAEAHNNLGIVMAKQGRLRDAVGEFQKALDFRPDFKPARTNLAAVLETLAESEK